MAETPAGALPCGGRPDLFDAIPDGAGFMTVAELAASTRRQAGAAGGGAAGVEVLPLGASAGGSPIEALRIGAGDPVVLAYGFPHANEPIGGVTLDYLAGRLAGDPDLARHVGGTWYIVKCADPDAARRNEGWFSRPLTPLGYALGYYRQQGTRQVEWGFPVEYRTLRLDDPIPEVRALKGLIDATKPHLLFSLHNSNLGGVYYWLMDPCPAVYPRLARLTADLGLPLHLGEPEHMMAIPLAPGVYRWVPVAELYDYFAANFPGDPAPLTGMGASCEEYARRAAGAFSLMIETPLFAADVVTDDRPGGASRRQAALEEIAAARELYAFAQEVYGRVAARLEAGSQRASDQTFDRLLDTLAAREAHVRRDPEFDRQATVAEVADRVHLRRLNRMLSLGMFVRLIEGRVRRLVAEGRDEATRDEATVGELRAAQRALFDRLRREAAALDRDVAYRAVPVRQAVAQQLAAMLATVELWREGLGSG